MGLGVRGSVRGGISLQMAPAASPGERGTVSEFMAKPRRSETPSAAGSALGEG